MTYSDFLINELGTGFHSVWIQRKDGSKYHAIVEIKRKNVKVLPKPTEEDMYTSWTVVKGNEQYSDGAIFVWAYKNNPEIMSLFTEPSRTVSFSDFPA